MSRDLAPMLCKEPRDKQLPTGRGWAMEPKLDGWRFLFYVRPDGSVLSLAGRNGSDRSGQPAAIERVLSDLPADTILDAEVVPVDAGNLQGSPLVSTRLANPDAGALRAVVFDVLRVIGADVVELPYHERRALLAKLSQGFDGEHVVLGESHDLDPALHDAWVERGIEGSVVKRLDSRYRVGKRSGDWLKVKPQQTDEAIVTGLIEGKNGRAGEVGAFAIEMLATGAESSVATLDDEQRAAVKLDPDAFVGHVIEIRHHGINKNGKPRHPVFARMRPDRDPA